MIFRHSVSVGESHVTVVTIFNQLIDNILGQYPPVPKKKRKNSQVKSKTIIKMD